MTFPARSVLGATVAAILATVALQVAEAADGGRPIDPVGESLLGMIVGFALLGTLIALRRPENRIGLVFSAAGAIYGLQMVLNEYGDYVVLHHRSWPAGIWAGWLGDVVWFPANAATFVLVFVLFPDGRLPSAGWRWLPRAALVLTAVAAAGGALHPGPLSAPLDGYHNPAGVTDAAFLDVIELVSGLGVLACWVAAVASLALRFHRADPIRRIQIRSFTLAGAAVPVALIASLVGENAITGAFAAIAITALPLSIGVAIFRHRLYDLTAVVRRTITYGVLVASLLVVYLAAIVVLGSASRLVTGQDGTVAVSGSTILAFAAFQPLLRRIRIGVDRRFARERYDAARTLETFAGRVRDQVDLASVESDVVSVVTATLQPEHVSLWLRPGSAR